MPEIEIGERKKVTETVDVDFPIIREHVGLVTKIYADKTAITIGKQHGEWKLEIKDEYDFTDGSGLDYHLGRKGYYATQEMFEDRLRGMQAALKRVEARESTDD